MDELTIAKFGGSSVRDYEGMVRCARILEKNPCSGLAVISATYDTTNQLEKAAKRAWTMGEEDARGIMQMIRDRHHGIASYLPKNTKLKQDIDQLIQEGMGVLKGVALEGHLSDQAMDHIYSLGERLSSKIFVEVCRDSWSSRTPLWFDVRQVIKTNSDWNRAFPDIPMTKDCVAGHLRPLVNKETVIITQGFIGSNKHGETTTLGREGSDYSATLLGEALNAKRVEIWTDVPGVFTTDPKRVDAAKVIRALHFDEAGIMAEKGANILFPKTLLPAKRSGLTVFVGSSLMPEAGGTEIAGHIIPHPGALAIALRPYKEDYIVSIIGQALDQFQIDLTEIDNSSHFRSFSVAGQDLLEVLPMIHKVIIKN